ncbi:MAG: glycerol-3-phosphate 1-O-acyltransferase PlsY [Candidatus Omnitrophica bacterium]|nr:glycerol-3-phosphate 1-O-acyltransferase PlsY [Candidatus Omnitrophota bacterium]
MMGIVNILLTVVFSYLVGALPTAYLFGKVLKGVDIRQHGSGNIGATNAFRVLGKGPGAAVLIIDIVKGIIAVVFIGNIFHQDTNGRILAAVAAVVGHNWTCFLNFKGGKGIATTLGVLIGLTIAIPVIRIAVFLCVLSWVACFLITAYVSVSSILAAVLLPILMVVVSAPFSIDLLSILFCIFIVFRHRPNIQRLLKGQESKVPLPFHRKN